MLIELTKDNFDNQITESTPIIVDFFATWCGPCRMLSSVIDQLAEETDGTYRVGKLNVDECADIAERYQVKSIPTIIVFKNGEPVNKNVGVIPKAKILEMLN